MLPDAARLACWVNAWLASRVSADDTIDGLAGASAVDFADVAGDRRSCALFLGDLRRAGVGRATAALPIPGDLLGLGGPARFNTEALEAGGAVVLHGTGTGLLPAGTSRSRTWQETPAEPPRFLPAVADADRELRQVLADTSDRLAKLDPATWRADAADLLLDLRETRGPDPTPFASAQAARLAHQAERALLIVEVAGRDDGGAISSREAAERSSVLRPLERAARAGLVAAVSSVDGR